MDGLSRSLEDYLEAIYILTKEKKVARVKDLSKNLGVKTPSVVGAIKSLVKAGLVIHERYSYIELTEKGEKKAQNLYEKHRILSYFFQKILGVSKEIADQDGCALEHHIHPDTYDRIIKLFEFLEGCPEEIPTFLTNFHHFLKTGKNIPCERTYPQRKKKKKDCTKLSNLREGEKGKIFKIQANRETRKQLLAMGMIKGEVIEIIRIIDKKNQLECRMNAVRFSLKKEEADFIFVEHFP